MGGKKSKKLRQHQGANQEPAECTEANLARGAVRVLLMRHGQSEANATKEDILDPPLTPLGRMQAEAWRGKVGSLGVECVLISPLRRAVETALLAFEGVSVPFELCRYARELWFDEKQNTLRTPEALQEVLLGLPQGGEVVGVEEAFSVPLDDPATEHESIEALKMVLRGRTEECVAVVCHWGVVHALSGNSSENAEIVECERCPKSGFLKVAKHHQAQWIR